MIITIGRKYGSGGRLLGEKLAKLLGYQFYDQELLKMAARESGLHEDVVAHFDEKPVGSLLYSTYLFASAPVMENMPLNQKLAFAQFDIIRRVAQKGNCVIVGRCADYVLEKEPDVLNVFITASQAARQKRLAKYYGIPAELTEKTLKKQDKIRAEYYNFFTQKKWNDSANYHICLDTGVIGLNTGAHVIAETVRALEEKKILEASKGK